LLLFPAAAFPPGSGGFRLGGARRPPRIGRAESLRHSARTISPDRRIFWSALRLAAPGDGGCSLLRHQFRPAGLWHQPSRLPSPAGISGLSLLGRLAGGAVVNDYFRQRILPSLVAGHHGQAPARPAGGADQFKPARDRVLRGGRAAYADRY